MGERDPEVAAVGVPILTTEGKILAVLCISGLISRFSEERQRECAKALQEKAQELAERIDPQPFLDMSQ
jgi:DNA-binding IclR family transcriptional regulator